MTVFLQVQKYLKYLINPLIILAITIIYCLLISTSMVPSSSVDVARVLQKSLRMVLLFVLFCVGQRFHEDKVAYLLILIGLSTVFFSELENVLDEFYNIDYGPLDLDLEDLSTPGLFLVGFGLFIYTNKLNKIRLRTEQSRRETELYATLLRHDLRNDLQAVLGYIEIAGAEVSRSQDLMESARIAALRMSRMVKTFSLQSESSDEELVTMIETTARDSEKTYPGMKIEVNADSSIARVRIYGTSLIQVALENLFRNAAQYCGETPYVKVDVKKEADKIEMVVSDNGPGIPISLRERIFLRGSRDAGGIGLYLVHTILKGCGGAIELLDSSPGTTFRILLPLSI